MPISTWAALNGTDQNDTLLADFAAADALYQYNDVFTTSWNRDVYGFGGDDNILRDRPGDYKTSSWNGNVDIFGDTSETDSGGYDTVFYSLFGAGIDVDLGATTAYGIVEARWTPAGETIYGQDRLHNIEGIVGSNYSDVMQGDDADNTFHGLEGNDTLKGGDGNDSIYGGEGTNTIHGEQGHDTLSIGSGGQAYGGYGDDTIYGSNSADVIDGGVGADVIYGYGNNDTLTGFTGEDTIDGGSGFDTVKELAVNGVTVVLTGAGNGFLTAYGEDDEIDNIEAFETGTGDDNFYFVDGNYYVDSGGGDDFANMGAGNDTFSGGSGDDEAHGGNDADYLLGEGNDDDLFGDGGNDSLYGGSGKDKLTGGSGNDFLEGGSGEDAFVFDSANTGVDYIKDFVIGVDTITIKPGFLADHPGIGGNFIGEVFAVAAPLPPTAPPMTLLYADTVDGYRHFATLENVHVGQANAAIMNSSLFYKSGGGIGGDWDFSDLPDNQFGDGGGFGGDLRSDERLVVPDRDGVEDMRLGDAAGGQVLSDALF
ncbi:MAG: calcium-binding protein [Pseudomonadota bacterium]